MKFSAFAAVLLLCLAGAPILHEATTVSNGLELPVDPATPVVAERPVVNIPMCNREANWGGGSCVHASMVALMRWQNRHALAWYWRKTYSGGESANGLHQKMDEEGVRYAYTVKGDAKFLEWACRTRRGCAVTCMGGRHMVALVHFDDKHAAIIDNNHINRIQWMSRERFLSEWHNSNGWAVAVIYAPCAPLKPKA